MGWRKMISETKKNNLANWNQTKIARNCDTIERNKNAFIVINHLGSNLQAQFNYEIFIAYAPINNMRKVN